MRRANVAALAAMYSEDAWVLATGLGLALEEKEAYASGDLGSKIGTYELTAPDGTVVDHGKYLEVWMQVDGKWLIHRDTYNSSVPLPVGGE